MEAISLTSQRNAFLLLCCLVVHSGFFVGIVTSQEGPPPPVGETPVPSVPPPEPSNDESDPCDPNPCQNNGVCSPPADGQNGDVICQCVGGFTGDTCDIVPEGSDPCDPNPCHNGGVCSPPAEANGDVTCQCVDGFTGDICDTEPRSTDPEATDPCDPNPCQNGGQCSPPAEANGDVTCQCVDDFTGATCENTPEATDPCDPNPCQNGGQCSPPAEANGDVTCQCVDDFTGDTCENEPVATNPCDLNPCQNGGQCSPPAEGQNGDVTCQCTDEYTGDRCQTEKATSCEGSPCGENGYCMSLAEGFECHCYQGWMGEFCSDDIDECASDYPNPPCDADYGVCGNLPGSYNCTCNEEAWGNGLECRKRNLFAATFFSHSTKYDSSVSSTLYVEIPAGFNFFGTLYHDLRVSSEGYIRFGPGFVPTFPVNSSYFTDGLPPMVAPYWFETSYITRKVAAFGSLTDYTSNQPLKDEIAQFAADQFGWDDFNTRIFVLVNWEDITPYPADVYLGKQNVTFQVLLASNGTVSMVVYNYGDQKMNLDPLSQNYTVLLGHTDGADNEVVLPVTDILRPDKDSNIGIPGRFAYTLGDAVDNPNLACIDWFMAQRSEVLANASRDAMPCPCTQQQAENDMRYMQVDTTNCYRSRFKADDAPWFHCCYEETVGGLLMEPGGSQLFLATDTATESDPCCTETNLCQMYYRSRKANNCSMYEPLKTAAAWGDPHFATFGEAMFTFNGMGEYVLVTSSMDNLMIQGRAEAGIRTNGDSTEGYEGTTFTALAIQADNMPKLEFRLNGDRDDILIHVDGAASGSLSAPQDLDSTNAVLNAMGDNMLALQYMNGVGMKVGLAMGTLWTQVMIPELSATSIRGLLGTIQSFRDNSKNITSDSEEQDIYDFGQNWTVSEAESLFTYSLDDGKQFADFVAPDTYIPMFYLDLLDNVTAFDEGLNQTLADEVCGNNIPCLTDYIASGNIDFANWTKTQDMRNMWLRTTLMNMPPIFKGSLMNQEPNPFFSDRDDGPPETPLAVIKPSLKKTFVLKLTAEDTTTTTSDEEPSVTFGVITNIPEDQWSLDSDDSLFTWILDSEWLSQNLPSLMFYAQDAHGASSVYWPTMNLDICQQGSPLFGTASVLQTLTSNVAIGGCNCYSGFSGRNCSTDAGQCMEGTCYPGVQCTQTDSGNTCGSCPNDMRNVYNNCYDEDECVMGTSGCSQGCQNLLGSFRCFCRDKFNLGSDQRTCIDVDECTIGVPEHNCTSIGEYCHNIPGGFECRCRAGFYMQDGFCQAAPLHFGGQLSFKAFNLGNSFTEWQPEMMDSQSPVYGKVKSAVENLVNSFFTDFEGFKAVQVYKLTNGSIVTYFDLFFARGTTVNGSMIDDVLRAKMAALSCTADGPDCSQDPIYGLLVDSSSAGEFDLCQEPRTNDCDVLSTECVSLAGRFFCTCRRGYQRWRDFTNVCADRDECRLLLDHCDKRTSVCTNIVGSYQCDCLDGYKQQTNLSCVGVCSPNPCMNNGVCSGVGNDYACDCDTYWTGPTCDDPDEDSIRLRNIAIAVGVVFGLLFLILLIVLITVLVRRRRQRYKYSCSPVSGGVDYYDGGGGRNGGGVTVEPYRDNRARPSSADYEMRENGARGQADMHRSSGGSSGAMGVENPSYAATDDDKATNKNAPDYF